MMNGLRLDWFMFTWANSYTNKWYQSWKSRLICEDLKICEKNSFLKFFRFWVEFSDLLMFLIEILWSIWSFLKTESACVGLDSRFHDLSLNFEKIVILERYVFLRFLIKLIKLLLELRFLLSLKLFLDWFRAEWYKFCKHLSKNRHFWVNFWIFFVRSYCSSELFFLLG
jgi:hypothetical protein